MIPQPLIDALFLAFSVGALVTGYRVFRTDSMVRAAFYLLASFAAVGGNGWMIASVTPATRGVVAP